MGHSIDINLKDGNDLPSAQDAEFVMECMMTHFIMQNQIIKSKLHHVQAATRARMEEIEKATSEQKLATKIKELKTARTLDGLWDKLISMLQKLGLSEDDIENIENTVISTPKTIRQYYEVMVAQDQELSSLIYEMDSDNFQSAYKKAEKITKTIQKRPNTMSGLLPTEYEPLRENIISTSGFEIITLKNLHERRRG